MKIADYGSSKKLNSLLDICFTNNVGTPIYMAPEILNEKPYNYKCDLWSIGVILYRLYFGKSPFPAVKEVGLKNFIEKFGNTKILKSENKEFDDLIRLLLEKDSSKRITWDEYFNHEFFNDKDDFFGNNDDEIIEENEKNFIIPFSLGIKNFNVPETQNEGDLLDLIIEKGSKLPYSNEKYLNIAEDCQSSMNFGLYVGDNKYAKYNRLVGYLGLYGIPRRKGGLTIKIRFFVDWELILTITPKIVDTEEEVKVKIDLNEYKNDY